ncbi:MAG: pirin family protein [Bacteroidales bacterium]|nr:pirin family protein [Bacteroidales bacterium]
MKSILHKANSRGYADHGWLKTHHSFSFASWYNPERMHFGKLRVLNDDEIAGGAGFGTHPHENMEIITIPLEGALEHKDSMGNSGVISVGEIQVMSAGTGIEHSEYNHFKDEAGKFLQIWIFPKEEDLEPRYQQKKILANEMQNRFLQIVGPKNESDELWIHQESWLNITEIEQGKTLNYTLKNHKNGVYIFLIEGHIIVNEEMLDKRDAIGIWETDLIQIESLQKSKILLIEVPMK